MAGEYTLLTGETESWGTQGTYFYGSLRIHYEVVYYPESNQSYVIMTPQFWTNANIGNDNRFFNLSGSSSAGIYGNGNKLYEFSSSYSSGNYMACGNAQNTWTSLSGSVGMVIQHDGSGNSSFTTAVYCSVIALGYVISQSPLRYATLRDFGNTTSNPISVHANAPYTLTYNANGGSGAPANQGVYVGISYTIPNTAPTRTGYTFKGWAESDTATTAQYVAGNSITPNGNKTLYAVWQINSYTLTLNKDSYISAVSGGGSKNYGASYTAVATLGSATGYTYSFDGWYEGSTKKSSSLSYAGTMPASNLTLTAKGTRTANTYYVKFNANTGSGSMSNESFTYDVSKALTSNAFTKTGYTFRGWDTNAAGTTVVYTNGQSVKNLAASGTVNLYAVWQINTWTVAYNANGGSGAPSSQTKTYNVALTLSSVKPTRASVSAGSYTVTYNINYTGGTNPTAATAARTTSYSFKNWNTAQGGSGTSFNPGASYTANAAATLYAQWNSLTSTAAVTLPSPTRTGYNFKGWATSATATSGSTGSYAPNGNVTLYAIWQLKTYTLSISQGAGSTISVTRGGTALSNGATISHFDTLSITISANTGYNIGTHTVNGVAWTSGTQTVSGNITVVSTATKKTYSLSITKSDTGMVLNVTRTESPIGGGSVGLLSNGATLYYNDKLTVAYSINAGYNLLQRTINGVDMGGTSKSVVVTENQTVVVTVELGAVMYIGDGLNWEQYQIFIADGVNWNQYQAYIGNGASWEAY